MTDFQNIDDFIEQIEDETIHQDNLGTVTTIEKIREEVSRLDALDETKFTEENRVKLEERRSTLKEILNDEDRDE